MRGANLQDPFSSRCCSLKFRCRFAFNVLAYNFYAYNQKVVYVVHGDLTREYPV